MNIHQITERPRRPSQETLPEPIFTSIKGGQSFLSVGHSKIYELAGRGEIELVKLDGKSLLTIESLKRYAAKLIGARP